MDYPPHILALPWDQWPTFWRNYYLEGQREWEAEKERESHNIYAQGYP